MEEGNERQPNFFRLVFNFIGFFSALSLVLVLVVFLPGAVRGDWDIFRAFFETYPGIEPFVIFIFPVILIGGAAWIGRQFCNFRVKLQKK